MPTTATADGYLLFPGSISGATLGPDPGATYSNINTLADVTDTNDDGNADNVDEFGGANNPYSGFTIEINGNDYAIFEATFGNNFFVPYFNTIEDLSGFQDAPVTQTITQSGADANVVNLCFCGGTLIATPGGERRVEDIVIGDLVTTADGRTAPIKWIGVQRIKTPVNIVHDDRRAPVCISAGTLDNHSDLYVSADHGMRVGDFIINAGALVNGTTVRLVHPAELTNAFTYYHVETEDHDVILANGAAAETFIDYAGRMAFDNYDEYIALYGADRIILEMMVPRISTPRLLPPSLRARFGPQAGLRAEAPLHRSA